MAKKAKSSSKEKQWLNIIIIVISAMILIFTLLGKFMEKGVNDRPNDLLILPSAKITPSALPAPTLTSVDFGAIKIVASEKGWRQIASSTDLEKESPAEAGIQDSNYSKIAEQWQVILTRPNDQLVSLENYDVVTTYFAQISLLKQDRPIVVKLELVTSGNQRYTLLTFVSANVQLVETEAFLKTLLPPAILRNPVDD